MLIKSVHVENFRCFRDETLECDKLTAIVGRNGSGKSSLLSALEVFYDISASITVDDFYNKDTLNEIKIRVVYHELRSGGEKEEFAPYLSNDELAVTKVIRWTNGKAEQKYYAATHQIAEFAEIRAKGKKEKKDAWNSLVTETKLPDIGTAKAKSAAEVDALMEAYEQAHTDQLQWIEREEQFFGPKNVGGGKLDKYTKFVRIPAVREASADLTDKRGSPLYQLLDTIVMRRVNARADVRKLKQEFQQRVKEVYSRDNLTELPELAVDITQYLQQFVPDAVLDLDWSEAKVPEIPVPAPIAELIEDEFRGAIDRKGHGLQRALVFALLQYLALSTPVEIKEESESDQSPGNPSEVSITPLVVQEPASTSAAEAIQTVQLEPTLQIASSDSAQGDKSTVTDPDLILGIEEPELYQHPLRSRNLANILLDMTQQSTRGNGARNQVLYTTHSPYFVDLGRFEQLRIVRKTKPDDGKALCACISRYSLQDAANEMALVTGLPANNFTADSFKVRALPVMTVSVNEGFFAEAVVVVEGLTEVAAISKVAEIKQVGWLAKNVALIPVDGKNKIDRAVVIFKGFGIPTYLVFDGDVRHKQHKSDGPKNAKTNRILLGLAGAPAEDFPATGAYDYHACFEDEFEAYCTDLLGPDTYTTLVAEIASQYCYDKPSDALKNADVVAELVEQIYKRGLSLPMIEHVVERVTAMAGAPMAIPKPLNSPQAISLGKTTAYEHQTEAEIGASDQPVIMPKNGPLTNASVTDD